MRVRWTRTAIGHLTSIYNYIGQDSPRYAKVMIDRITARSEQIALFPQSGQVVLEYQNPNIREVIEGAYRIIHEADISEVRILAVIHGARQLPPLSLKDTEA